MASEQMTDAELADELEKFGEIVQLPIHLNKRHILRKKLNHLRARSIIQNGKQSSKSLSANSWNRSPSVSLKQGEKHASGSSAMLSSIPSSSDSRARAYSKYTSGSREGQPSLETQSSDDSDMEHVGSSSSYSQSSYMNHGSNHVSARDNRERKHTSQLSDSVLRTLRRRTVEPPPRHPVKSKVPQPTVEKNRSNNSVNDGSDGEIPVPSPARSRLYPNLSKMSSFLSQSNNSDKFESSDSDLDSSSVFVENKSVNTSLPYVYQPDAESTSRTGHVTSSPSHLNSSITYTRRAYPLRRNHLNGHYRVQQYRSKYLEMLPQILVGVAVLFFVTLSVTYIVIQKDFFFSWFTSSNNIGSDDNLLRCSKDIPAEDCYAQEELDKALLITEKLFEHLSLLKGKAQCDTSRGADVTVGIDVLKEWIKKKYNDVERLYECCLRHIVANPHWKIRALRQDGSSATEWKEVVRFESEVANMSWFCRLLKSLSTVLYEVCLSVIVVAISLLLLMYIKYRLKQRELEQKEVYAMVEKIVDFLQMHYEQTKEEESSEAQYLAVQHVRDQLLPPSKRRALQPIWNKAVEFIVANESRIRLETRLIRGEEFEVWHWLQPSLHNGKIWQGQAFGENSENKGSNQVVYSPTPCLKIRNMFDSNVENEDNWEDNVTDAILEKCKNIDSIVHVYVDVDSREGCVYLKCSSCEAAGRARLALHGWWFDGRLVTVKHLKTDHYHKRWPEARDATRPLKPSTDQMRSLSQPYYRSSLEMT